MRDIEIEYKEGSNKLNIPLDVESFFLNIQSERVEETKSTLYLLRRDIQKCFEAEIFITATMLIMTGIDLLGKFLYQDNDKKVRDRFKNCLKLIDASLLDNDTEILFQLRNSLIHSFGFYSSDKKNNIYHFILSRDKPHNKLLDVYSEVNVYSQTTGITRLTTNEDNGKVYCINIEFLREQFEKSLTIIKAEIVKNGHFEEMSIKYGAITIKTEQLDSV